MNKPRLAYLHARFLDNQLSPAELEEWKLWLADESADAEIKALMDLNWHQMQVGKPTALPPERSQRILDRVFQADQFKPAPLRLWIRIAMVAAAVAAITLGVWLYDVGSSQVTNDIAPGRNTATLTLADGKTINLSDAKTGLVVGASQLSYNDGTEIKTPATGGGLNTKYSVLNTVSTPRGGTYQVVLPDGTKAWLNAASSIRFPSSFAGAKQRLIEMTGEVYLEVAKDKARPFIVKSRGQQVEVLGTHFNINAYPDEDITRTTLLEGAVSVSQVEKSATIRLKPNQQAITTANQPIKVTAANVSEITAWKDGYFRFNEEKMSEIVKQLDRWYDVKIELSEKLANEEFTGKIARNRNISRVLQMMEKTNSIEFKIEGRRIKATEK